MKKQTAGIESGTNRAGSVAVAHPLYQGEGGGSIPTSALQLWVHRVSPELAVRLNRGWHSTLPRIGDPMSILQAALCFGASFDDRMYAVAIWTHPVSRLLPQGDWLELRRLAIASDAPKNTASRMLRIMAKFVKRDRPQMVRLISYQDTGAHTGGIYRAAGWVEAAVKRSNTQWNMPGRPRPQSQSLAKKIRWEREV